jgi:hypothetical protein
VQSGGETSAAGIEAAAGVSTAVQASVATKIFALLIALNRIPAGTKRRVTADEVREHGRQREAVLRERTIEKNIDAWRDHAT